MNAFNLIQAKFLLQYEVREIDDDSVWVTDALEDEAKGWFQARKSADDLTQRFSTVNNNTSAFYPRSQWPVLIQAPTGRGKNWFTIRCLANYANSFGSRILLLTNRSALTKQQRIEAAVEFGFPDYGQDVYDKCCIWGNIDIINYHNAIQYIFDPNILTKRYVSLVVFDEAHFFCSTRRLIQKPAMANSSPCLVKHWWVRS